MPAPRKYPEELLELERGRGSLCRRRHKHRFRHTLATRMINHDVPEIAVQQMLDHSSPLMTWVYAKLHDRTLREHYDRYQERIKIRGEIVSIDRDGPFERRGVGQGAARPAKLTLPNGYCGRPLQSHRPHPTRA